jgi:hypothetical protein
MVGNKLTYDMELYCPIFHVLQETQAVTWIPISDLRHYGTQKIVKDTRRAQNSHNFKKNEIVQVTSM